jgi:two-component system chemotaxis response regulator CheY
MDVLNAGRNEYHVAIVEDEKDLARMYELILAMMGIPVSYIAASGPEAIVRFKECSPKPRIVLMDNRLLSMSGVDVTKAILAIEPATRIIFLSADCGVRDEAIKAGAALFVSKPARVSDIVSAIMGAGSETSVAGSLMRPLVNEPVGSL